jgi:hypothetical protein
MKLSVKSGVQRFYSVKSLLQIGDNVVDVLCTDRKTDGVVKNLLLVELLLRQLGVGVGLVGLAVLRLGGEPQVQRTGQAELAGADLYKILVDLVLFVPLLCGYKVLPSHMSPFMLIIT